MREYSKVSPTVWRSKKFRSLKCIEARHVYLYLLTCPHANSAGCFDIHPLYACADMGLSDILFMDCINSLCEAGLIEWDEEENTVLISNWIEYNGPSNPKHALGIISQLQQVSSERLRLKAFQELSAEIISKTFNREASVRKAMEAFCEPYRNGIATETETETRRKEGNETRLDDTETKTREEVSRTALRPVAAEGRDGPAPEGKATASPETATRLLQTTLMRRATA